MLQRLLPLASNYLNLLVTGLATLFLLPIYVRILGPDQWGLLALCLTAQGFLFSLDAFIAPRLQRDIARANSTSTQIQIWHHYRRVYWMVSIAVVGMVAIGLWASPFPFSPETWRSALEQHVALMVLVLMQFVAQFCNNAALGTWYGQERHAHANARSAAFLIVKHGLAFGLIWFWAAQAWLFVLAFVIVGALEFGFNQAAIKHQWREPAASIQSKTSQIPAQSDSATVWTYLAATFVALCSGQLDRVYLSQQLSAADFGMYYLVGSVWLSMLSLLPPIQRTYMPRIAQHGARMDAVFAMYKPTLLLVVVPSLLMAAFSEMVLRLWLADAAIASAGAKTLRLGLVGIAGIALYAPLGNWLFTQHRYATLLSVNVAVFLAQVVILKCLTPSAGMVAGAWSWLLWGLTQGLFALILCFVMRPVARAKS